MKKDEFIALSVFFLALMLSVKYYQKTLNYERPSKLSLSGIKLGHRHFELMRNEQCISWINVDFSKEDDYSLKISSQLKVKLGQEELELDIKGWAFFNALKQLIRSEIVVSAASRKIILSSENANPIKIILNLNDNDLESKREFSIQGPIFIEEDDKGEYFINLNIIQQLLPSMQMEHLKLDQVDNVSITVDKNTCNRFEDLHFFQNL